MEEDVEFNSEELKLFKREKINENNDPSAAPLVLGWLILLLGTFFMLKGWIMFDSKGEYLEQSMFFAITGSLLFLAGNLLIGIYYITLTMKLLEQNYKAPANTTRDLGLLFLIIGISLIIIGMPKFESRGYSDEPDYFNLEQVLYFTITGSITFLAGSFMTGIHYYTLAISKKNLALESN